MSLPSEIIKKKDNSISYVRFSTEDALKVINNLDLNKSHGRVLKIGTSMFKIFGSVVCRPLEIILNSCLGKGKFSLQWKNN